MTAADNVQALAALRHDADAAKQHYFQVLAEINSKRAQLAEAMAALAAVGCNTLAEAEETAARLQDEIDDRVAEIRRLLA